MSLDEAVRWLYFGPLHGAGRNVGLVLTRQDEDNLFEAAQMTIVPRDADNDNLGPVASCSDCSRLVYPNTPANLTNYQINVTMSSGDSQAVLHATDEL